MSNKIEIHKQICNELTELYTKKNADYGDSFAKTKKRIWKRIDFNETY